MASKSMLILLNSKLAACLIARTSVRESGLTVSTETLPGETILFFHIDCNEGRQSLNLVRVSLKICDYLVFYTKDNEHRETVCLLELKGKKLEDAVEQIVSTHQQVKALVYEEVDKKQHQYITWKVCICMHGQAPRNDPRSVDQLKLIFGKDNVRIKHGIKHDKLFGSFLRK